MIKGIIQILCLDELDEHRMHTKGGEKGEMGDWGEKVEWDAKALKVTNLASLKTPKVADLIKPKYQEGYRLD